VIGTTTGREPAREATATRGRVMLVLPRADHVRGYAPLAAALPEVGLEPIVVSAAADGAPDTRVRRLTAEFYGSPGGAAAWLRLVLRRELAARRLLRELAPDALVVPSDVSDALAAFVAAARRRRVPVVYVQGVPVFADFPRLNAETHAARARHRRLAGALVQSILGLVGIHVATAAKAVLGSRADRVLVMDDEQAQVHVRAGVPSERVTVTGAPFVDRLVALRRRFDAETRRRTLAAVGVEAPVALILTKSLHRLGWTTRDMHDTLVRDMVDAVRAELPGWTCLVKLHPAESVEEYGALTDRDDPPVHLVKEAEVEPLLLASDVAISLGTSGAALSARVLGTRLVVVTHPSVPMLGAHGHLAADRATVRSAAELRSRLREVRATPAPPAADSAAVATDGRASERIARALREIVQTGRSGRSC
jgi:UDP-N-acetylglucosamine 2-epimerase